MPFAPQRTNRRLPLPMPTNVRSFAKRMTSAFVSDETCYQIARDVANGPSARNFAASAASIASFTTETASAKRSVASRRFRFLKKEFREPKNFPFR